MIENQEELSLAEFKAWLAGLIRGKRGALPDLEDWKAIKDTLDKVVPDTVDVPTWTPPTIVKEYIREPSPTHAPEQIPYVPYQPIWITEPNTWHPEIGEVWCGVGDNIYGGAGYYPQGQAGYVPQGYGSCGGNVGAAGGTIGDAGVGVSGCSTIKIDNSAMSPTHVEGDMPAFSNGSVVVAPEQMSFNLECNSCGTTDLDNHGVLCSDNPEPEPLDNAMAMLFAKSTKEL